MQTQQLNDRYGGNKGAREHLTAAKDDCIVNCPIATMADEFLVGVSAMPNEDISDLAPRQSGGCRCNNQITGVMRAGVNVKRGQ
jgi:hypothetical protein